MPRTRKSKLVPDYSYSKKIIRRCMEKYFLLTKLAKCTLNIALKLTFSFSFTCLIPFFERQFFTQMTVENWFELAGVRVIEGSSYRG